MFTKKQIEALLLLYVRTYYNKWLFYLFEYSFGFINNFIWKHQQQLWKWIPSNQWIIEYNKSNKLYDTEQSEKQQFEIIIIKTEEFNQFIQAYKQWNINQTEHHHPHHRSQPVEQKTCHRFSSTIVQIFYWCRLLLVADWITTHAWIKCKRFKVLDFFDSRNPIKSF